MPDIKRETRTHQQTGQALTTSGLPPRRTRHARKPEGRSRKSWIVLWASCFALLLIIAVIFGITRSIPTDTANIETSPATNQQKSESSTLDSTSFENQKPEESKSLGPSDDRSSTREKSVQTGTDSQQLSAAGSHPTEQVENQENFPSAAANPQVEGSSVNQLPTKSTPAPNVVKHTVQKGDTLFKLSRHYYGNNQGWKRIARYNGLDPDDSLPIGKVLSIPSPTRS